MFPLPVLFLLASLHAGTVPADEPTPLGVWKTIDDETRQARSLVQISEHDGVLSGQVIELFRKRGEEPNPRCEECRGERHNQSVVGMTILWNMHRGGDTWEGGEILDPESGKIYRCNLHVTEGGSRLEVRGFIGFALLGRTQVWERVPH
jgi:uncharacterized protein (DUF2147 family)